MPIVRIELKEGRPIGELHQLIDGVTTVVSETLRLPTSTVQVLVYEVPRDRWGIGGAPREAG